MNTLSAQIFALRNEGKNYEEIFQHFLSRGVERKELHQGFEGIVLSNYGLTSNPQESKHVKPLFVGFLVTLFILIVTPLIYVFYSHTNPKLLEAATNTSTEKRIASKKTEVFEVPVPEAQKPVATSSSETKIATASPQPLLSPLKKSSYTIALYGDSMIDTMGDKLPLLNSDLQIKYPKTKFNLYNYGIGSENVTTGLSRFDEAFNNKTRHFPSISQIKADVIVLGSFAYNPFSSHDRNKHWLTLAKLIDQARGTGADIYVLAEIAPLKTGFGVGPNGVNWPSEIAGEQSRHIREQLVNAVGLAKQKKVALINVFAESETGSGFGNEAYVNSNDGIHPSVEGQKLTAGLIAQQIELE